jgi:hypothetical protein
MHQKLLQHATLLQQVPSLLWIYAFYLPSGTFKALDAHELCDAELLVQWTCCQHSRSIIQGSSWQQEAGRIVLLQQAERTVVCIYQITLIDSLGLECITFQLSREFGFGSQCMMVALLSSSSISLLKSSKN